MDVFSSSNSRFSIVNHRLVGGGVIHLVCEKNRRTLGEPEMIILHYTAGRDAIFGKVFGKAGGEGFCSFGDREGWAGDTTGSL